MRLSAGLSQSQIFSPQMQQGLQLLEAPIMELRQLVSAELAINPMLEEEFLPQPEIDFESSAKEHSELKEAIEPWREEMNFSTSNEEAEERRRYFLESYPSTTTLSEMLHAQCAAFPKEEEAIIEMIIGSLDDSGYLRMSCTEIAEETGRSVLSVEKVLKKIQQLHPPGIAARNLNECLILQLERQGNGNGLASRVARHYLPQLARHQYQEIAKLLHVSVSEILETAKIISYLEPHPGRPYNVINHQEVIPDAIVFFEQEKIVVRLNREQLPRLRINAHYKEVLAAQPDNIELRGYLRDHIRDGKNFIQSVEQRQETLLLVCREIVRRQEDFFRLGIYGMHPLTMADVASLLNLHPTTIGRAVAGKYIDTP
ncbi:MAG: RNA polymerase sigma-54 factor, partial [Chthoniobacterales bacterium]